MSGKCDICGKTLQFGHNVSHSKRRTNRVWMPNTSKRRLLIDGKLNLVSICTRCLRTMHKVSR